MNRFKSYQKYFVLLGGFLLHLSIGNLYSYNNMSSPLIDYMKNFSYSKNSIDKWNAVWIFSLSVFGLGSSVTLGGIISNNIGPSLTVLIGGWFMSINVLLMSYTIKTYLFVVILSYGLCTGIGSGLVYGVTIGTVYKWFPKEKGGFVCGIIVSGFGLSAFIFDLIQYRFKGKEDSILTSYIIIGSVFILIQFIGSLLLSDPPKVYNLEMSNDIVEEKPISSDLMYDRDFSPVNVKPHHIYLELDYWVMWITFALLSACFTLIVSMTRDFGEYLKIGQNERLYLFKASVYGTFCNAFGRIAWGFLIDRIRYKIVMLILTVSLAIFFGTFYFCWYIDKSQTQNNPNTIAYYFIWLTFLYFIPSGIFSIFPCNCARLFGSKHFVSNYGLLFTAYSFGGLITGLIYTFSAKNYWGICIAGSVMSAFAALVTFIYRGKSLVHRMTIFD